MDSFQYFLLVGGLLCSVLGGLVVFSNKFLGKLEKTLWKQTAVDEVLFAGRTGYWFNRYGRGLGMLTLGIGMLALLWQSLHK